MGDFQVCNKCGGRIIFRKIDGVAVPIHVDGACGEITTYEKKQQISRIENNLSFEPNGKRLESLTIPNTNCPVCGTKVFYYENEHGSKVFFDELGPPWPKHPCTLNEGESSAGYKDSSSKGKWYKYELEELIKHSIEGGYEYEWMGRISDGSNQRSYLISLSESKLDGIIHQSCYIKKTDTGKFLVSFIRSEKDYKFEDTVLYSVSLIDTEKKKFIDKQKRLNEQRAKKNENAPITEEVRIKCRKCKKILHSMERYSQHIKNECIYRKIKNTTSNPRKKNPVSKIEKNNPVKYKGEFLCFHCNRRFSSKEKYHNHACK